MAPKRKRKTSQETDGKKFKSNDFVKAMKYFIPNKETDQEFSTKRCESWFRKYTDGTSDLVIGPDGIEQFCADLGVDPEDIVMLVIAWKLEAENMGYFKFTEWNSGMYYLKCDTTAKLRSKLDGLRQLIREQSTFKKIYRYAFDFCREKDQRSLDMETGKGMLRLLLKDSWPQLTQFLEFLGQTKYKVINRDQWNSILEFSRSVDPSYENYDVEGAWPVMLDEFVEWMRKNR